MIVAVQFDGFEFGIGFAVGAEQIHGLLTHGMDGMNEKVLGDILTYANAGAALITMKKGAIRSMPDPENITKMIEEA